MTENQLAIIKKALIDVEQREARVFDSLPQIKFIHSEEYEKKIATLLAKNRKQISYTPRKIAAILIAATLIFALSITAFAFRESIKNFFIEIYEDFVAITASNPENEPLPTKIESFYTIYEIPDGFEKIENTENEAIAQQGWLSDFGMIVFQQSLAKNTDISSSNENPVLEETQLGDKTLFWIQEEDGFNVFWTEKGYIFNLTVFGEFSVEKIENMISSVAPKQ